MGNWMFGKEYSVSIRFSSDEHNFSFLFFVMNTNSHFVNFRGAYVNVARYRDWIDKVMQRFKLENSSYIHE